jgi:hypothetical protein
MLFKVASRTTSDSFYLDDTVVRFFPSGDDHAMAEALLNIIGDSGLRNSLPSVLPKQKLAPPGQDWKEETEQRVFSHLPTNILRLIGALAHKHIGWF